MNEPISGQKTLKVFSEAAKGHEKDVQKLQVGCFYKVMSRSLWGVFYVWMLRTTGGTCVWLSSSTCISRERYVNLPNTLIEDTVTKCDDLVATIYWFDRRPNRQDNRRVCWFFFFWMQLGRGRTQIPSTIECTRFRCGPFLEKYQSQSSVAWDRRPKIWWTAQKWFIRSEVVRRKKRRRLCCNYRTCLTHSSSILLAKVLLRGNSISQIILRNLFYVRYFLVYRQLGFRLHWVIRVQRVRPNLRYFYLEYPLRRQLTSTVPPPPPPSLIPPFIQINVNNRLWVNNQLQKL